MLLRLLLLPERVRVRGAVAIVIVAGDGRKGGERGMGLSGSGQPQAYQISDP